MPISPRNIRIGGSVLTAILMVAGAYVLPGLNLPQTKPVNAELTDDLLASYVSKDTDQDGLPDWQEALYGTSKDNPDSDGDGIQDGEAVRRGLLTPTALASQLPDDPVGEEVLPGTAPAPGSITEQFARAFFEAVLKESGGAPMTEEAQAALVERLLADFSARAARSLNSSYTQVSVRTSHDVSVTAYAGSVEQILRARDVPEGVGEPLPLMQALMEEGDESARTKLRTLARSYAAITSDLVALRVPPSLTAEHLALVRSFDMLAKATTLVADYEGDPLGVIGALTVYPSAAGSMLQSLSGIAVAVLGGGEPAPGTPGALIVNIARSAETP